MVGDGHAMGIAAQVLEHIFWAAEGAFRAATGKKPVLRNRPLDPPQGRRVHACPGGRIGPRQAAHSGTLPQRGRMGPWCLWCGVGVPLLLPNLGPEYRPATVGPTRRNSAVAPEATARSHAALQRTHPRADARNGLVIAHHIFQNLGRFVPTNAVTAQVGSSTKWIARSNSRADPTACAFPACNGSGDT